MRIRSRKLIGKDVYADDGLEIGEVSGLIIDAATWHVAVIEVQLIREALDPLGIDKPLFGMPNIRITTDQIASVDRRVRLRGAAAEIRIEEPPPPRVYEGE